MFDQIKGLAKVEKFEAIQNENGEWVPVSDCVESVVKNNGLSLTRYMQIMGSSNDAEVGYVNYSASSLSVFNTEYPKYTAPASNDELYIWISEFGVESPGALPAESSNTTLYNPQDGSFGLVKGSFREFTYTDDDASSETTIVIKYRFDPDTGRSRSIRGLGLRNQTALKLDQVFTQTATQIVDVTYTIVVNYADTGSNPFKRNTKLLKKHIALPVREHQSKYFPLSDWTYLLPNTDIKAGVCLGINSNLDHSFSSTTTEDHLDGKIPYFNSDILGTPFDNDAELIEHNNVNFLDGVYGQTYPNVSMPTASGPVGMLVGNLATAHTVLDFELHDMLSDNGRFASQTNINSYFQQFSSSMAVNDSSSGSAIQNIFPRDSASNLPYQDVDFLATGTGDVALTDSDAEGSSWTGNDDGFAKKYRIQITTGGATGTSEYNLLKRNWHGTAGNKHEFRIAPSLYTAQSYYDTNNDTQVGITNKHLPFGDDVDREYHGQYPGLRYNYGNNDRWNDNYTCSTVLYNYPEFITHDKTGLTIAHANEIGKNFTSNFTEICQVVVDHWSPNKNIYVADVSTGLWKIERSMGQDSDASTITRLTASNAADDTECRGVQIKVDGTIWAIFGEEMCSSSDAGSTWTVYNATSSTQFKLTNILDTSNASSTPARVFGFVMDRHDSRDRFLIPYRDATKLGNDDDTRNAFWWSRDGSSSGTSDEHSFDTSIKINRDFRWYNSIFCTNGGLWLFNAESYTTSSRVRTFGSGGQNTTHGYFQNAGTYFSFGPTVNWWYDSDTGEEFVLGSQRIDNTYYKLGAVKTSLFDSSDNTGNYSMVGGSSTATTGPHIFSYMMDQPPPGSFSGTSTDDYHSYVQLIDPSVMLYIGDILYQGYQHYNFINFTGSEDDLDQMKSVGGWTKYGWDSASSSWVEGSTTSKATHTSRDSAIDGLMIKFSGAASDSFVQNEYYDAYVYNGILKDNATTLSIGTKHSILDITSETSFASTVPSSDPGEVTEKMYAGFVHYSSNPTTSSQRMAIWPEQDRWTFAQSINNVSFDGYIRSEARMSGDFTCTFKIAALSGSTTSGTMYVRMGLSTITTNDTITKACDYMEFLNGGRGTTDSDGDLEIRFENTSGTLQSTSTFTDFSSDDIFKIERTSGSISYYRNSDLLRTDPNTVNDDVNFFIEKDDYGSGNVILDSCRVTYTDGHGGRYVEIGNGSSTGASDVDFRKIVQSSTIRDDYNEINIDGVPATIKYDMVAPAAGEVTILPFSGRLWFNDSDAGSTITGKIGYLKKLNPSS